MKARSALSLTLLAASALLGACRDDGITGPGVDTDPAPKVLGLVEITVTGIGTPGMRASVTPISGGSAGRGGAAYTLSAVPGNAIQIGARTASTLDAGGQRYLQAVFAVRNAMSDGTANGTPRQNVTFIPVSTASTIAGTPVYRFNKQDGSPADPAIAAQLRPTGAVMAGAGGAVDAQYADVLQALTEAELEEVASPPAVTNKFPYGFVTRRVDANGDVNGTTRELPANPAADQFDGRVTFAYRFPIQAQAADNPFTISVIALAVDDSETRVTQSLEEQSAAARAAFEARAAALSATSVTVLSRGLYTGGLPQRRLCSVRVAGNAGPSATPLTRYADIVINEIMTNPAGSGTTTPIQDSDGEYVELLSRCSDDVNLNGYIVQDGTSNNTSTACPAPTCTGSAILGAADTIDTDVIIPAGALALLARSANESLNGGIRPDFVYTTSVTGGLTFTNTQCNGGTSCITDLFRIRTPDAVSVDSVAYRSLTISNVNGTSRELIDPTQDNSNVDGGNWRSATAVYYTPVTNRGTPSGTGAGTGGGSTGNGTVQLSTSNPAQMPVGYDKPTFATVKDANGNDVSSSTKLTYTSSNTAVATVDTLGYVTGVAPGVVTITATAPSGATGSFGFTVVSATAANTAVYRNHEEFGTPTDATPGDEFRVARAQFVASYNPDRGQPNWVAWNLNASQFEQGSNVVPRCNCFTDEPTLTAGALVTTDFDYRGSGYDRGHMVQSESRTNTFQENATTFLLSNIVPQAGANNQGPWGKFESFLNGLVQTGGKEVYVISGGEFGATPFTLKNQGRVPIPDYTWKVAIVVDAGEGLANVSTAADVQVYAIRIPNLTAAHVTSADPRFAGHPSDAGNIMSAPWQNYRTTVDFIEARTGYDLFAALEDSIEA
ncbi:MAG: DNA/RNA non-specific endonuclease, partial [Gemmatimonadetes bacterium]|nr:DNA/RNA non-specific endonuclease [Gemmatimonadota bacterium]